ncbi:MAG: putative inorganic carbon transporter subunit DabA, partial [Myxococcota bacterium]
MTRSLPPRLDKVSAVDLSAAIETATARVAPVWPLDRFIAVNPLWGFLDQRLPEAAAHVGALSGARLTMPRAWYRSLWEAGRFEASHIDDAIEQLEAEYTAAQVIEALATPEPALPRRALVTDLRDRERDGS